MPKVLKLLKLIMLVLLKILSLKHLKVGEEGFTAPSSAVVTQLANTTNSYSISRNKLSLGNNYFKKLALHLQRSLDEWLNMNWVWIEYDAACAPKGFVTLVLNGKRRTL